MNKDLKLIKKKYGEGMAKLCRELFPTILETEGLLPQILMNTFNEDYNLYYDIINNNQENDFKNYIYKLFNNDIEKIDTTKTPQELLNEAGYNLYKCETERDIQRFKKYYACNEELCTFNGGRLCNCYVYFAVKKDVGQIKRENFSNPKRQDLYGTSVISIQFTKDKTHTLSIKNRYNHTVNNPDATFSNNLDNIISGLTEAFAKHEGMVPLNPNNDFEIPGYVKANDGRYYKYNFEFLNTYFCPNNIIIDQFHVHKYNKDQYLIIDNFILDLKAKTIAQKDGFCKFEPSFEDTLQDIQEIFIAKKDNNKEIHILTKDGTATIIVDKNNNIIGYQNNFVTEIADDFMILSKKVKMVDFPNLKIVSKNFMKSSRELKELNAPNLEIIGDNMLKCNYSLEYVNIPNAKIIGKDFLLLNEKLKTLIIPKVQIIGDNMLEFNYKLEKLDLSSCEIIGKNVLMFNHDVEVTFSNNIRHIGKESLMYNKHTEIIQTPTGPQIHYRNPLKHILKKILKRK